MMSWILRRLGFKAWYLASMWLEVWRSAWGRPPITWKVGWNKGDERLLTFGVRWNRRRWRLDIVPLPEETEK